MATLGFSISPSASEVSARVRAQASHIAISSYLRRQWHVGAKAQLRYIRSYLTNQPFTSTYEPGQPTNGPLGDIPLIGRTGPTPRLLKQHLDDFVIGQDRAKKTISTAVFNHYQRVLELRRRQEEEEQLLQQKLRRERSWPHPVEDEFPGHQEATQATQRSAAAQVNNLYDESNLIFEKSNILLLGPSGVGKTLMARTLARVLKVPFSMSDCTPFTQAGYIGEDAQVCVERLLAAADYDVEAAEHGIIVLDEVDKIAAQRTSQGKDVGGEGVQQALLKIIEGTTLHLQVKTGAGPSSKGASNSELHLSGNPASGAKYGPTASTGSASGASAPMSRNETYTIRTENILFIFTGAFVGLHKHVLARVQKGSIGFGNSLGASMVSSSDDTNNLLTLRPNSDQGRLFEKQMPYYSSRRPGTEPVQYNPLDLVVPADLQAYGMIPELIGRIPVVTALSTLDETALFRVLTEPKNSLVKQYEQLFRLSGIELRFTSEALYEIAKKAYGMGTGARALRSCVERLLSEAMFEAPGSSVKHILITGDVVRRKIPPVYLARGQQYKLQNIIADEEKKFKDHHKKEAVEEAQEDSGEFKSFEDYRARSTATGCV